jgi:hypothetical protein
MALTHAGKNKSIPHLVSAKTLPVCNRTNHELLSTKGMSAVRFRAA